MTALSGSFLWLGFVLTAAVKLAEVSLPASSDAAAAASPDYVIHGLAEPFDEVELSAPFAGVLMKVLVHEGESIEAGAIVAVMDNRVAEAAVRAAEAEAKVTAAIESARMELELAENKLRRIESIDEPTAISEFERDEARARRDQAAAALAGAREKCEVAQSNLALERARLETHNIRSPISGVVTRVDAEPGTTLSASKPLARVADLRRLKADLYLPLEYYGTLHPGQAYRMMASAPVNRQVAAKLLYCEPTINAAAESFRAVFEIDNTGGRLPAGFGVRFDGPLDSAAAPPDAASHDNPTNDKPH